MRLRQARHLLFSTIGAGACVIFWLATKQWLKGRLDVLGATSKARKGPPSGHNFQSLHLDKNQCEAVFPGLTNDINYNVALGPFKLTLGGSLGPLQVRIKNGRLYIAPRKDAVALSSELLEAQSAALHQIDRAIITSPEPLPNTILSINIRDQPFGAAFSYARPTYAAPSANTPPVTRAFLMPHFSFWSWPLPFIGSMSRAAAAIDAIEREVPFTRKIPTVVWRGTRSWSSSYHPRQREDLIRVTKGAPWADVQPLTGYGPVTRKTDTSDGSPHREDASNALMIEDFCRYKYIIYTEGVTYSGRLQFHQMCKSVLLSPPIAWLQHTTHLIRPLFSSDLPLIQRSGTSTSWQASTGEQEAWPVHYWPKEANMIFVAPDWSDLEATVNWLEEHPETAEGIATRQRDLFVGKGYLSPAAETCYWRSLIKGWSKVVQIEEDDATWEVQNLIPWETFVLGHHT